MANQQRDGKGEARWRELLARHASSGLSVRVFCQQEKLNESSFYAWRRTIAERDQASAIREEPPFVPAAVTSDAPAENSISIELPSGCVLRLSGSMAMEQLAELVIALQERGVR